MHTKSSRLKLNIAILAYSVMCMMFCVDSSPLVNELSNDSPVFYMMGRAMAAGKTMYKDIFDHKGFYLYVINALGVILTPGSLFGLFVLECVLMFMLAKTVFTALSVFADEKRSFIGMQIFILFTLLRKIFAHGNMTEDYGLLFQVLAVYMLIKDGEKFSCLYMFFQGMCAGIVLCLRANIAMMWGGVAIVAGYEMLRQKKFLRLSGNIAAGISGVIAAVSPAVIYAVMTDSVKDMMFGMFEYNIIYLSGGQGGKFSLFTLMQRVLEVILYTESSGIITVSNIMMLLAAVFVSCILVLKSNRGSLLIKYYFAMLLMTVLSIALSGRRYPHYYESLVPFCLPFAFWAASKIKSDWYKKAAFVIVIFTAFSAASIPRGLKAVLGRQMLVFDDFVKYNEPYYSPNERVLVTNNFTHLYNALGVIPQEKYFYIPANNYEMFPEPRDSQTASILSGVNDVIIVVRRKGENDIYPETGKSREISEVLEQKYDLLYYKHFNDNTNAAMYGKKRN